MRRTRTRSTRVLPRRPVLGIIGSAVGAVAGLVVIVLVVALLIVPRVLGGASLTVLTGSMSPVLEPGDVAVVRGVATADVCQDVSIGQIVTYLPDPDDPALITHRVVGKTVGTFDDGTTCRLVTQGDANSAVDDPVSPVQVRGVLLYAVPWLGLAREWAVDHASLLVAGGVALLLLLLVVDTVRPARTRVVTSGVLPAGAVPVGPGVTVVPEAPAGELGWRLRERELDLREHELDLRESALRSGGGRHRADALPPDVPRHPTEPTPESCA